MTEVIINSTLPAPSDGNTDGWVIAVGDIKGWKNKDRDRFLEAINEYVRTGIGKVIYPELARLIKRWPFAIDPADPASYGELNGYQLEEAVLHVTAAFQQP